MDVGWVGSGMCRQASPAGIGPGFVGCLVGIDLACWGCAVGYCSRMADTRCHLVEGRIRCSALGRWLSGLLTGVVLMECE